MSQNLDKPMKEKGSGIEQKRELTSEEIKAFGIEDAPYFIIAMANMSASNAQIFQVSVDGGAHWGNITPPIGRNCQYGTVPECNEHHQLSQMATVSCGTTIRCCIRWKNSDGTLMQGCYPGSDLADCHASAGIVYGFTD
jgi:hypothetical protein